GTQPGLVGGAVRGDRRLVGLTLAEDLDAFALVLTVEDDADDRMLRLAGADELLDGLAHLVARDREADTDVAAAAARADRGHRGDGAVDADHLAGHVEQRAATVAGVD